MLDDRAQALIHLHQGVVDEAIAGLRQPQKSLPPKLFYDEEGCRLFRRITDLPEYYLTRTERALLESVAPVVAARMPTDSLLVEYGASDESKAEFLLRERGPDDPVFSAYMPIDVAAEDLGRTRARLARSHPDLHVHTLAADFLRPVTLPRIFSGTPRLGFFPGSTIGNLEPMLAEHFLAQVRETLGDGARLLIGVDLRKDPAVLVPAYDDAAGVTAAFNLNLLARLNREVGSNFDLAAFNHHVLWNDTESRIEMHLVSNRDQHVSVAGHSIRFSAGETIHTENSYKHTEKDFLALADRAGWVSEDIWKDPAGLFSIHLLQAE